MRYSLKTSLCAEWYPNAPFFCKESGHSQPKQGSRECQLDHSLYQTDTELMPYG